jgi:hypothetical protein
MKEEIQDSGWFLKSVHKLWEKPRGKKEWVSGVG